MEEKKHTFVISKEETRIKGRVPIVRQTTAKPRLNTAINKGASRGMLIGKYVKYNNTKVVL